MKNQKIRKIFNEWLLCLRLSSSFFFPELTKSLSYLHFIIWIIHVIYNVFSCRVISNGSQKFNFLGLLVTQTW